MAVGRASRLRARRGARRARAGPGPGRGRWGDEPSTARGAGGRPQRPPGREQRKGAGRRTPSPASGEDQPTGVNRANWAMKRRTVVSWQGGGSGGRPGRTRPARARSSQRASAPRSRARPRPARGRRPAGRRTRGRAVREAVQQRGSAGRRPGRRPRGEARAVSVSPPPSDPRIDHRVDDHHRPGQGHRQVERQQGAQARRCREDPRSEADVGKARRAPGVARAAGRAPARPRPRRQAESEKPVMGAAAGRRPLGRAQRFSRSRPGARATGRGYSAARRAEVGVIAGSSGEARRASLSRKIARRARPL